MITIVDYSVGNLASIQNMLRKVNAPSVISSDPETIAKADKLILPGVGAFDYGMTCLKTSGLRESLETSVSRRGIPILGICLGVQLFTRRSDEGKISGLGWIKADTIAFDINRIASHHRIPHMGWADLEITGNSPIFEGLSTIPRFYFVHSFHLACDNDHIIIGQACHGYPFVAAIEHENIVGVQFHPEKSHRYGMQVLHNFAEKY